MADALGRGADRDAGGFVDLLGRRLLDMGGGQLHLDDVRAELRGDLRRVADDVDGGLARLRQGRAAGVGPDHHGEPDALGLFGDRPNLAVHGVAVGGARIDREADGAGAEPQGVRHRAGDRLLGIVLVGQEVVVVELEDQGDAPRIVPRPRLQEAERRRVGVAPRRQGQLEMVQRVVGWRIRAEAPGGAVLETLVHRQDQHLAGAAELSVLQHPGEVGERPGAVGPVPRQDLGDAVGSVHRADSWSETPGRRPSRRMPCHAVPCRAVRGRPAFGTGRGKPRFPHAALSANRMGRWAPGIRWLKAPGSAQRFASEVRSCAG